MVFINNSVSPPKKFCQKVREPTPEPVVKRIFVRAPTPQPDIIERVIIKPQPRQIIEKITQQPKKPPPRIIEKVVCEPCQSATLVKNHCVLVEPHPHNNFCQYNHHDGLHHHHHRHYFQHAKYNQICAPTNKVATSSKQQICTIPSLEQRAFPAIQSPPYVVSTRIPPPPPIVRPSVIRNSSPKFQQSFAKPTYEYSCKPEYDPIRNRCICKCYLRLNSNSTNCTYSSYSSSHSSFNCSPTHSPTQSQTPFLQNPSRYYAYIIVPPSQTYSILALYN